MITTVLAIERHPIARDNVQLLCEDQQAHAGYYATSREFRDRGDLMTAALYADHGAFTSERARRRYCEMTEVKP